MKLPGESEFHAQQQTKSSSIYKEKVIKEPTIHQSLKVNNYA